MTIQFPAAVRCRPALAFLAAAVCCGLLAAAPARASWSLVWADEFNGSTLDATNWTADVGNGCPNLCGWGNAELEYYRAENLAVTGGNLVITAKAESFGGASYTSGKVHSRGKRTFLYGRVEMRAKLPVGGGMWPAFWMMPQSSVYGGWPQSGEIDIMEAANGMTSVGGTIHYGGTPPNNTSSGGSYSLGGGSFADAYHVYAVEWEPDQMRWYVDGALYSTKTSALWYSNGAPSNARAPFDQPFYIIMNAAVGGYYTGCTSSSCVTAAFPQQYLIDYVRVYEDIVNALPVVTITTPAPAAVLPVGDIAIAATASDPDGTVASVEFWNGATLLNTDTTAPYAYTWAAVTTGCYAITVRAIDNLGGTSSQTVDVTVGAGCGQIPFSGDPQVLPGRIQVENFDGGGEGVAYHDADSLNNGGQYRAGEGVDLEACTDTGGGYNAGWLNPGEWIEYTVQVPVTATYVIRARVASLSAGGSFRLEFGGIDKTGAMAVPVTGGWQTWTTLSTTAQLTAGTQVLRFVPTVSGFNVNWFEVAQGWVTDVPGRAAVEPVLLPCAPNPFNPRTTLRFELPAAGPVRLAVYDVAGRLVRTLLDESRGAGSHETEWDGRDASGQAVGSGVYLARLEFDGKVMVTRMGLLR
jgi:beta-glucanase (GH16 family)